VAIQRKGRPCNLTLEFESVEILRTLCPNGKSFGKFLSDLIRAEEQRRIEARRLRERLYTVVDEVLTAP
jgi:hypothetical protein